MEADAASEVGLDRFEDKNEALAATLLVVAGRLVRSLDEACRKWGITDDQYNVLRILRDSRPGGQPRYAISEKLINRAPDVTRLLDRLESKGLVLRTRSGPDRRQSISTITRKGLDLLDEMAGDVKEASLELTQGLSQEEREVLRRLLHRLIPDESRDP